VNIALWIIASLLAAAFLAAGLVKLGRSKEQLAAAGEAVDGIGVGHGGLMGFRGRRETG